MNEMLYDIIIVGGGPGGSSCGIFLKKLATELRVCIVDKHSFPRNKPCGDGLSPAVVDILTEAGLAHIVADRYPISVFELTCGEGLRIKYDMRALSQARSFGFVYDRKSFDHELLQQAIALGVDVFQNHEIIGLAETADGYTQLQCRQADDMLQLKGRIIVGADGAYSKIRSYLNLPPSDGPHKAVSLRYYCTTQLTDLTLRIDILKNLKNSYGWVFPLSPTTANVGIGVDSDVYKEKKLNLNHEFEAYLKLLKKDMPLETIPGTRAGYPLPYGTDLPPLVHGNKVLIGDAASMINPLTGEGIYYAMYAGQLVATHIANSYRAGQPLPEALTRFATDFQKHFKPHYRLNLRFKKLLQSPFAKPILKMLQHDPALLHKVMPVVMGNATTLDVKNLPLRMVKKLTRFSYRRLKQRFLKRPTAV